MPAGAGPEAGVQPAPPLELTNARGPVGLSPTAMQWVAVSHAAPEAKEPAPGSVWEVHVPPESETAMAPEPLLPDTTH